MSEILGVDAGNHRVKVFGERGEMKFRSDLGEYRDLKLMSGFGPDDMIYQYNGAMGFAGELAYRESEFNGTMMSSTKAHSDMLIRVLLALHRYTPEDEQHFKIIVGQPISNHVESQKSYMRQLLVGEHNFSINGKEKKIIIERAEVSPEGAGLFWSAPKNGKIRILDVGSGTVNGATIEQGIYIDKESFTLEFGLNTNMTNNIDAICRKIFIEAVKRKWRRKDEIYIAGGNAEGLLVPMLYHYENAKVWKLPQNVETIYANSVGFYNIGKQVLSNGE